MLRHPDFFHGALQQQRGKSGSVRVIYVDFEVYEKIYLLTAYAKNEKENLSDDECNELRLLIKVLENQLSENTSKGEKK